VAVKWGDKMRKWRKIAEGKTKIIWQVAHCPCIVKIESKDAITAGDGTKRDVIEGKGILANNTTCNVFELLERKGIETHYIGRFGERFFLAYRCKMIPIEVVIRRIATGSYLKRHPEVEEGEVFEEPVIEFFLKDDKRHDPIIDIYSEEDKLGWLHEPKEPITLATLIEEIDLSELGIYLKIKELKQKAKKVFLVLEEAFKNLNIVLWDLKIEFGKRKRDEKIIIADVIDNDSWRIRDNKGEQLDKQVYRNGAPLEKIKALYQRVSELTNKFKDL